MVQMMPVFLATVGSESMSKRHMCSRKVSAMAACSCWVWMKADPASWCFDMVEAGTVAGTVKARTVKAGTVAARTVAGTVEAGSLRLEEKKAVLALGISQTHSSGGNINTPT